MKIVLALYENDEVGLSGTFLFNEEVEWGLVRTQITEGLRGQSRMERYFYDCFHCE